MCILELFLMCSKVCSNIMIFKHYLYSFQPCDYEFIKIEKHNYRTAVHFHSIKFFINSTLVMKPSNINSINTNLIIIK